MRTPRLVATDVDGTLLGADDRPSARTRAALDRVHRAGVPVVLATGRPPRWVADVCATVGVHEMVVAANGAVLYDATQDRVLEADTLEGPDLAEVVAGLRSAVPGCRVGVERVGETEPPFLCEPGFAPAWVHAGSAEVSPAELTRAPVIKVMARRTELTSDVMAKDVRRALGHLVDVTFSTPHGLVECSARGVTKASGLARAAERLGVGADEVVAFGDMPNDAEMLRWAGLGVAMGNGHPTLVAAADEVTASNLDDGVASVLERWF